MLKCHSGSIKPRSVVLYRDTDFLFLSLLHLYREAFLAFPSLQTMHKGILCQNLHKHGRYHHLVQIDGFIYLDVKLEVVLYQPALYQHILSYEFQLLPERRLHLERHVQVGPNQLGQFKQFICLLLIRFHYLVVQDIEDEMRRDAVAGIVQLQVHDIELSRLLFSAITNHKQGCRKNQNQENAHNQIDKTSSLLDLHILMFYSYAMMQLQGVLGKTLHDINGAHMGSIVCQGILHQVICLHNMISQAIVALSLIIFSQILMTNLAQQEVHLVLRFLSCQYPAHGTPIFFLYCQSDTDGIAIVDGTLIGILTHVILGFIQILL